MWMRLLRLPPQRIRPDSDEPLLLICPATPVPYAEIDRC